jgi:hypothetical protein
LLIRHSSTVHLRLCGVITSLFLITVSVKIPLSRLLHGKEDSLDWLTFIAQIVQSLAWPTGLVILILLIRRPLLALLPELDTLKLKGFELTFRKKIEEVDKKADLVLPLPEEGRIDKIPQKGGEIEERELDLTDFSPRAAVLESWLKVEEALRNAASRHSITTSSPPGRILIKLAQQHKLDHETTTIYEDLRALRNNAVHVPDAVITPSQAKEFERLANRLARKLREL